MKHTYVEYFMCCILKNGDECDSFHGIAAIREIDRQVASLKERVRTRAGEREREWEEVRVWCTQS